MNNWLIFGALALPLALHADLTSIQAEPDPGRRSEAAMIHADAELDAARTAYQAGNLTAYQGALTELRDSVNLADDSLQKWHKNPRKTRQQKSVEMKLRLLIRRLSTLRDDVSVDDRQQVEDVLKRLQEVHDELLTQVMGKRS